MRNLKGAMLQKESILYMVIGVLTGIIITIIGFAVWTQNDLVHMMGVARRESSESGAGMHADTDEMMMSDGMDMSMSEMVSRLEGKQGDAFDQAFLEMMIDHHQGAIDMAKEAQERAKHDEVRNLANNIIQAQTNEINQMQDWQQRWGYMH